MNRKITASLILLLVIVYVGCENVTEPERYKSPSEYTWVADTLSYPGSSVTELLSIWADNPNDVYICGNTDFGGEVFHFDGNEWSALNLSEEGLNMEVKKCVFGFSSDNVWIAGGYSRGIDSSGNNIINAGLANYNGHNWIRYEFDTVSEIWDLWGTNPNDIWACGENGIVLHYNGANWGVDTINTVIVPPGAEFLTTCIRVINNVVNVMSQVRKGGSAKYYHLAREGNTWIIKHQYSINFYPGEHKFGGYKFCINKYGKVYSYGFGGIFEYRNNEWVNIFNSYTITGMSFYSGDNFIAVSHSYVHNYENGNWMHIDKLNVNPNYNLLYYGIWANNETTFIVGILHAVKYYTVVLRGN